MDIVEVETEHVAPAEEQSASWVTKYTIAGDKTVTIGRSFYDYENRLFFGFEGYELSYQEQEKCEIVLYRSFLESGKHNRHPESDVGVLIEYFEEDLTAVAKAVAFFYTNRGIKIDALSLIFAQEFIKNDLAIRVVENNKKLLDVIDVLKKKKLKDIGYYEWQLLNGKKRLEEEIVALLRYLESKEGDKE